MAKALGGLGIILVIGLAVLVMLPMAWGVPNSKKDAMHIEAVHIRTTYRNDLCEGTEMYFSPKMGTLLILCGIPRTDKWGGIIWRVTENNGQIVLGEEMYEVTVFGAERRYWNNVIKRDLYAPLFISPHMQRIMREGY